MASDGKVVISTALDNKGLEKGVGNISGSLGGLKNVLKGIGSTIAAAFSVATVVQFGTAASKAATELSDAMTGLQSIMDGQGRSFSDAEAFIEEYTKDGLIPATNAITAYKNLAMRGYDDRQIRSVMNALKDASAYGRQASYTMGEAVQSASEGLKNENSVLVDNAGVTKNVAKMWEEYAASIGTTANNLTQQQKIQAEVTGILEESKYQTGDAAKVAGTLSGRLQQLSFNFNNLKVAVGNIVNPIVQAFLPVVNSAISTVTRFANAIATVVGGIFGKATVQTEAMTEAASAGAAAEDSLAESVENAGRAAKKSLAGFDELQTLQEPSSGSSTSSSAAGTGAGGTITETVSVNTEVEDNVSSKLQPIIDKIHALIEPLKSIDFAPAKQAFIGLGESVAGLGSTIGKHLEWYWFNVLVPLADWTIEEAAPAALDTLSAAFDAVTKAIDPVLTGLESLWDDLEPVHTFIQDSVILVFEKWEEVFNRIAEVFEEKGPEIERIFTNIGDVFSSVWVTLEPSLTTMRDIWSAVADIITDLAENKLGLFIDRMSGVSEVIAGLATGDWERVWSGMSSRYETETGYIEDQTDVLAEAVGLDFDEMRQGIESAAEDIGLFMSDAWTKITDVWNGASQWFQDTVITPIQEFFSPIVEWFSELFNSIWESVSVVFEDIGIAAEGCWQVIEKAWEIASTWFDENVIQPVADFFDDLWEDVPGWASDAWEGVKEVFNSVGQFFKDTFSEAWDGIVEVFSPIGETFTDIKDGVVESFKEIANDLIEGINEVVSKPFEGINTVIRNVRDWNFAGITPFSGLKTITAPQIPYLAQGAVLPANKPFLAMVGDQKHGTNVEAPLSTIQEAVALVMQDHTAAILAGFEASVGVQKEILEAVLGIQIGDDVIGNAAARYSRKLATMRGGTL